MTGPIEQLNQLRLRWDRLLARPDWYVTVIPEIAAWRKSLERERVETQERAKALLYDFFEGHLQERTIALGENAGGDQERKAIDTVVVHHTSNPPGMSKTRLSAIELVRLYAPYYLNPTVPEDGHLRGSPISSGHLRDGMQVFWPYHWIVRPDGRKERLLRDDEIGWHAGNWDINCRSVAIVLDNDHEWTRPSQRELQAVAAIISRYYAFIPFDRIVGHREVNQKTTCPSRLFLDKPGVRGWKRDLLEYLTRPAAAA